jgi:hypothetical protein
MEMINYTPALDPKPNTVHTVMLKTSLDPYSFSLVTEV